MIWEIVFAVSKILEQQYFPTVVLLGALAMYFSKQKKALLLALVFSSVLLGVPTLKNVYGEARPCANGTNGAKVPCDSDYGFPSGHATTSTLIAASTTGTLSFYAFLPASIFISASRIYLGVHTFKQVAGGVAFGVMIFFLSNAMVNAFEDFIRRRKHREKTIVKKTEMWRQVVHIAFGTAVIASAYLLGFGITEALLLAGIYIGLLVASSSVFRKNVIVRTALRLLERKDVEIPAKGALLYVAACLFLLTFSRSANLAIAGIAILAVGDGISTLIGVKYGRNKLFWNKSKSWEGTFAFASSSFLIAFPFIGLSAWIYAVVLALIETIDFHIDDNLLIPIFMVVISFAIQ